MSHFIYISDKKYAFKKLFNEFYPSQVMFAYKLVNNMPEAEDIVQEVFLNIWRSGAGFKNEITFKSYLYLSTRNKCIDFYRRKKIQNQELDSKILSIEDTNIIVKNEAYELLYKAIQKLPPKTKIVILKSLEGLSLQEVADFLDISINTVKTQKKHAYKTLRELYGDIFILFILNQHLTL